MANRRAHFASPSAGMRKWPFKSGMIARKSRWHCIHMHATCDDAASARNRKVIFARNALCQSPEDGASARNPSRADLHGKAVFPPQTQNIHNTGVLLISDGMRTFLSMRGVPMSNSGGMTSAMSRRSPTGEGGSLCLIVAVIVDRLSVFFDITRLLPQA